MDQQEQLNDLLNSMDKEMRTTYMDFHYLGENRIDTLHKDRAGGGMTVVEWWRDNQRWIDLNKVVDRDYNP